MIGGSSSMRAVQIVNPQKKICNNAKNIFTPPDIFLSLGFSTTVEQHRSLNTSVKLLFLLFQNFPNFKSQQFLSFLSFNENILVARNSKKLHPERSRKFENWTLLTTFYILLPTLVSPGILWLRFLSQDDRRFPRLKLYQNNGSEEEISGNRIIIIIPRHYARIERVYATPLWLFSHFSDRILSVEEQDHFGIFNWRKIFVIRTRPGTTNSLA